VIPYFITAAICLAVGFVAGAFWVAWSLQGSK